MLRSTDEFLACFVGTKLNKGEILCSLDVESLFTNVPVQTTVEIILNRAYNHPTLPSPAISQNDLRDLLLIATQETPFRYKNEIFVQVEGVSMGSPLGPTMADFYMAELESKLLNEIKISNPVKYLRYVDDTICIFKSKNHIHHFIRRLTNNSELKFTYELMDGDTFHFLDVSLKLRSDGCFDTSVFIKPTDNGLYTNYSSLVPQQYKHSVVSFLVNRALKICSTPEARTAELHRLTQVLVNNGYPQFLIDKTIRAKLRQLNDSQPHSSDSDSNVNFFVELHNVSNFRRDTKRLKGIMNQHVLPAQNQGSVALTTFYKPMKLSSKFSTRQRPSDAEKSSLVYQFLCPEQSCNDVAYIGYTNQRLITRVQQHRYSSSGICKHYMDMHNDRPPVQNELINHFKILYRSSDLMSVKIAEAILIKNDRPIINTKYSELYDFLRLF